MRPKWLPAILVALALHALGQAVSAEGSAFQVDFSNPELSPTRWTLTLHPDGSGHFRSERHAAPAAGAVTIDAPNVDRDVHVSAEFADRVFQTAHSRKFFRSDCESHLKVAFQGWKKFSYSGPDGQGSCEFNFAKDKEIQALGDSLVAVAETIVEGARLEMLRLHDPLGLDHEMEYLVEAAGDGRVQQIGAIRGILERLAGDEGVIESVRKRARLLLAKAEG
jgi:hypothetical protein